MKDKIEQLYIQALIDDLPPNVFADQILRLFDVSGSLPTDELIENKAVELFTRKDGKVQRGGSFLGFVKGAKWMRDLLRQ